MVSPFFIIGGGNEGQIVLGIESGLYDSKVNISFLYMALVEPRYCLPLLIFATICMNLNSSFFVLSFSHHDVTCIGGRTGQVWKAVKVLLAQEHTRGGTSGCLMIIFLFYRESTTT